MIKKAIYVGSFNPFHIGHLNILEKAEKIFGRGNVLIAIGVNPEKGQTDISIRCGEIAESINENLNDSREVIYYTCFTHELIERYEEKGYNVVLIRGLRNGDDLDYEDNQLKFIEDFKKDINVVFLRCDDKYEHVSSSAIRALESFREGSGERYLVKRK